MGFLQQILVLPTASAPLALGCQMGQAKVMELQRAISAGHLERMVGQRYEVLVEGLSEETDVLLQGRYYGQAPEIDGVIYINDAPDDIGRGQRLARDLDAGMIWVNSENNRHLPSPFGGMKASGIGRDGGDYSFEFYMETKNVCIAMGTHRVPQIGKG